MKTKLFIDMDGVIAAWQQVSIEVVASKGYFLSLKPVNNVIDAVKKIISAGNNAIIDAEVYILSATFTDDHSANEKREWLKMYLPEVKEENIFLVPYGYSKDQFLKDRGIEIDESCILLDDFTQNCVSWESAGGQALKLLNGINSTKKTWKGTTINGLADAESIYKNIMAIALFTAIMAA